MKVAKLWWSSLSLLVLACPPPPVNGNCADETCTAEQRCDANTLHCVTDEPPTLTVVAPTEVITTPTYVVTGKVTDDGAAAVVEWRYGESGAFTTITPAADGTFSLTIDTPVLDAQSVVLHVRAKDALTVVNVEKTLSVDVVAPTIVITAPVANSVQTGVLVDLAVTTSTGTVEVLMVYNGAQGRMDGGPTSWTSMMPIATRDDVDDVVRFIARDAAGNTTTVEQPIRIDNVAPQVTITSPAADTLFGSVITVDATTDSPATGVMMEIAGNMVPMTGGPLVWTVSTSVVRQDYGNVFLTLTAVDAAGNMGGGLRAIRVDSVPPVITFTAPNVDQRFNAANLAANSNVTTSWEIADRDSQAATTTVNGAASSAVSVSVPTSATDNPTTYTTTVTAADRAGNVATASISYSVDRVIPTVVSWTPASGRMLVAPNLVITFSEPVFGATTMSPALTSATGVVPAAAAWDLNHTRYTFPFGSYWDGKTVDIDPQPVADDYGNPVVAPPTRRYHVATVIPSGTLLASNVRTFAATSDGDGELRAYYLTTSGFWGQVADSQGVLYNSQPTSFTGTRVTVNAWNTVNPSTLLSTPVWGGSIYDAAGAVNDRYRHVMSVDGSVMAATHLVGAVVSAPPLSREGVTDQYGLVIGNQYTRGSTFTRNFTTFADMVTAVSGDSWAVASYSGSQVRWSRYRCNRDTQVVPGPATYTCGGTEYGGALGSLPIDFLEAVMTRSGNCLVVNASAPQGASRYHGGWAQRLENCDGAFGVNPPASCTANTTMPLTSGALVGQKFAPFSANGEDTLLVAFPAGTGNPSEYRLEKMLPGTCGFNTTSTPPFSVPNVRDYQPVQIGNKAAFIYVNTSNELRLFVP